MSCIIHALGIQANRLFPALRHRLQWGNEHGNKNNVVINLPYWCSTRILSLEFMVENDTNKANEVLLSRLPTFDLVWYRTGKFFMVSMIMIKVPRVQIYSVLYN